MFLTGLEVLRRVGRRNAPLRNWLDAWAATVETSTWTSLADVRQTYPSADGIKLESLIVVTVFNVKGNEYRLLTSVDYIVGVVDVLDVLIHAEYSRNFWKGRY